MDLILVLRCGGKNYQVPSRYVEDVWELVDEAGKGLRQTFAMFPTAKKYIFVNGSPCQDLTIHSAFGGTLGITGTRSAHFFAIVAVIILIKTLAPKVDIWLTVENAGSMAEHYLEQNVDHAWPTIGKSHRR